METSRANYDNYFVTIGIATLGRPVARDGDAVHEALLAVIVVDRVVLGGAVVPKRDRARRPAKAASELGPDLMGKEIIESGRAFFFGQRKMRRYRRGYGVPLNKIGRASCRERV